MATSDYGQRFTDTIYATKGDVSKALGTSLIDIFWKQILTYRTQYQKIISIRNINKTPFRVTFTSSIVKKMNAFDKKIDSVVESIRSFSGNEHELLSFYNYLYKDCVNNVSKRVKTVLSLETIKKMVFDNSKDFTGNEGFVCNYFSALKELENLYNDSFNQETLSEIHATLSKNPSRFSLYRETNYGGRQNSYFVREYDSAPVDLIEVLMDNLMNFLEGSDQGLSIKLAVLFYMINLIKPFDNLNEEFSVLACKYFACKYIDDRAPIFMPFEDLICKNTDRFKSIFTDTQKENDMTYAILFVIDTLLPSLDDLIVKIQNYSTDLVREEFREAAKEDVVEVVNSIIPEEMPTIEHDNIDVSPTLEVSKQEEEIVVEEEKNEVIIEPITEEKKVEQDVEDATPEVIATPENTQIFNVPKETIQLSEREAAKFERYIIESDPMVKKQQAHFYARHCTFGRYYSIQQYKKFTGCVYETARTSMDNLANLGYYKKEQIKNKFVYTPLRKFN